MRMEFSNKMSSCCVLDRAISLLRSLAHCIFLNLNDLSSTSMFPCFSCVAKATFSVKYLLIFLIKNNFSFLDIPLHSSVLSPSLLYDIYNFLILFQLIILDASGPVLDCEHPEDRNHIWVTLFPLKCPIQGYTQCGIKVCWLSEIGLAPPECLFTMIAFGQILNYLGRGIA